MRFSRFLLTFLLIHTSRAKNACKHLYDYLAKDINPNCYDNPDFGVQTEQIIKNHGFEVENHPVTTPDGYEIQLLRIPGKGQPIFFYSGIWGDATNFVFIGDRALAFSFARDGYDVYLGDYRGTVASRKHEKYSVGEEQYWNYTMDDVAVNDVPTLLEKVANVSGKGGDIIFLGHARGFFLALMYLCNNPNEKLLRGVAGMSPAAYQDLGLSLDIFIRFIAPILIKIIPLFNQYALFQNPEYVTTVLSSVVCPFVPYFCYNTYYTISGQSEQFLPEDLLNYYSHIPSSVSLKELEQESQLAWSKRLQKYNYGFSEKNLRVYNQSKPPIYDLGTIKNHPVILFYSTNDNIVTPKYVKKQYDDLGTEEKEMILIPEGDNEECGGAWSHLDFLTAKNMTNCLYKVVLERFRSRLAPRNNQ